VTAASRSHKAVLDLLITAPDIDLFIKNLQHESVYDIAAEKGDLVTCELIERYERAQWIKRHPNRTRPLFLRASSWTLADLLMIQSNMMVAHCIRSFPALLLKMHESIPGLASLIPAP